MATAPRPVGLAPAPHGARTVVELVERLRLLQAWAGMSYRDVHRQVVRARRARGVAELPALNTVYRCFDPKRVRLDAELVVDVARALLGDDDAAGQWRQACTVVSGQASAAAVAEVTGLPDDLAWFTGRSAEIDTILGLAEDPAGPTVVPIEGMPGVGKTRLAVHAGHLLLRRGRCAGVQLAVDLRGYDAQRPPADPGAVLEGFLRRLGEPAELVHRLDLAARATRYRQLLHDRDALVLLDNAATAKQIRPLLPDGPGCLVLLTGRRRLELPGVTRLPLGTLRPAEAVQLLGRAAPPGAVDADRDTAGRIAALVGHLPLALALVAARIRDRPDWSLTDHLDRLAHRQGSLQVDGGVEAALGLSYDDLGPQSRRMFRLLALHPGETVDPPAAAALAGVAPDAARRHLDELLAANLLQSRGQGRYGFHDLVRVFAAARAHDEDAASNRRSALTSLFDHCLHTAAEARTVLYPADPAPRGVTGAPPGAAARFAGPDEARAWLDIERPNLLAVATHCAWHGWPEHAIRLAQILWRYLDSGGYYADALALHRNALDAAGRAGDRAEVGRALRNLGTAYLRLGRYDEALDHLQQALAIRQEVGDRPGQEATLNALGAACYRLGRYGEASGWFRRALGISAELADRAGQARATVNLGQVAERLGRYPEALDHYREALAGFQALADRDSEAYTLTSLGVVLQRTGRLAAADEVNEPALGLFRQLGDRSGAGYALNNLGMVRNLLGEPAAAAGRHEEALALFREVGDRHGESDTLNCLGLVQQRLGRWAAAVDLHRQALAIAQEIGDIGLEAQVYNGLGSALRESGQPEEARHSHECALVLADKTGDRYERARALDGAAHATAVAGRPTAGIERWQQALDLYTDLGAPEAAAVRAHLTDLAAPSPAPTLPPTPRTPSAPCP